MADAELQFTTASATVVDAELSEPVVVNFVVCQQGPFTSIDNGLNFLGKTAREFVETENTIIVLPEEWLLVDPMDLNPETSSFLKQCSALALKYNTALVLGTLEELISEKVKANCIITIDRDGSFACKYRQRYLHSDDIDPNWTFIQGSEAMTTTLYCGLKLGFLVCGDIETYNPPMLKEALEMNPHVIINPAHIIPHSHWGEPFAIKPKASGLCMMDSDRKIKLEMNAQDWRKDLEKFRPQSSILRLDVPFGNDDSLEKDDFGSGICQFVSASDAISCASYNAETMLLTLTVSSES